LTFPVNIIGASCKHYNELQVAQVADIAHKSEMNELEKLNGAESDWYLTTGWRNSMGLTFKFHCKSLENVQCNM